MQQSSLKTRPIILLFYATLVALGIIATHPAIAAAKPAVKLSNTYGTWLPVIPSSPDRCLPVFTGNDSTSWEDSGLTQAELELILLINQERAHTGLNQLEVDPTLVELAREKSRDMVSYNYFGHLSEQLGTVYDQLQRVGFPYQKAAENLVGCAVPRKAHLGMMSSPAHRSNLLNPRYTKIGIGIARGGPYGGMITEIFVY